MHKNLYIYPDFHLQYLVLFTIFLIRRLELRVPGTFHLPRESPPRARLTPCMINFIYPVNPRLVRGFYTVCMIQLYLPGESPTRARKR